MGADGARRVIVHIEGGSISGKGSPGLSPKIEPGGGRSPRGVVKIIDHGDRKGGRESGGHRNGRGPGESQSGCVPGSRGGGSGRAIIRTGGFNIDGIGCLFRRVAGDLKDGLSQTGRAWHETDLKAGASTGRDGRNGRLGDNCEIARVGPDDPDVIGASRQGEGCCRVGTINDSKGLGYGLA